MPEKTQPADKGNKIIELLKTPAYLHGDIKRNGGNIQITDEEENKSTWDYFVTFPRELSAAFPGSYLKPDTFLHQLGIFGEKELREAKKKVLGHEIGAEESPVFKQSEDGFQLTVMNGMLNEHALEMTKSADASMRLEGGFKEHPEIRAIYQKHMYENIKEALHPRPKDQVRPAYRMHDDCLASGDSIMSYIWIKLQDPDELAKIQKSGIEVVIDGPATAQSILLLRAFAKEHGFNLDLVVGHMAFGLSEGVVGKNGVRKHANYITYPDQLLDELDSVDQELLQSHRSADGNIYVVGDMGDAERGIDQLMMKTIREAAGDQNLCAWNDTRKDPHGDHPNRMDVVPESSGVQGAPTSVYFARGGYLPYELDRISGVLDGFNVVINRVSRKWSQEFGYGAAINEHDESS